MGAKYYAFTLLGRLEDRTPCSITSLDSSTRRKIKVLKQADCSLAITIQTQPWIKWSINLEYNAKFSHHKLQSQANLPVLQYHASGEAIFFSHFAAVDRQPSSASVQFLHSTMYNLVHEGDSSDTLTVRATISCESWMITGRYGVVPLMQLRSWGIIRIWCRSWFLRELLQQLDKLVSPCVSTRTEAEIEWC